jgi:hypothetical protein
MVVKKIDDMNFIIISIDLESKLLKKRNLRILKFWRAYIRCLDINSLKYM